MKTFDYGLLEQVTWDNEILSYVAQIHEYKGRQELFSREKPTVLQKLMTLAKIQSTDASNRLEGIITTDARLKELMADKTKPRNRDEWEILGYRNALNTIHESYEYIPVTSGYILQLHRDLLQYTAYSYGGKFKTTPNEIIGLAPDGSVTSRFRPLAPYETPEAVATICGSLQAALAREKVPSLILIPCFILDFLCIHPFNDGNGRMSRLLTLLLLYRSGYTVGKYISLEKAIADTKESYYTALQASDQGWHEGTNTPLPFIRYMLAIILSCYRNLAKRLATIDSSAGATAAYETVKRYALNTLGKFSKQDLLQECPSLSNTSATKALKKLADDGVVLKIGNGKNTQYVRQSSD
ncbi:MAG: Fic family protein [Selenomonadaceae bacterium]|nr:Fic family protein [Selenomonadaceae bacterium]